MRKSLTVWLLQTGEPLHIDSGTPRPMRAMNLADALLAAGHKVVLWSSSFYHQEKLHRVPGDARVEVSSGFEICLLASPGYGRNIGPGRLWDHAVLGKNLGKALRQVTELPDVAFLGYPPIETASVMANWLADRKIPFMVDVKDQWPTIFTDPLPAFLRPLGRMVLAPYFYYGKRALRNATALSAMADGFLHWAANFAGREVTELDRVVPLTTPVGQVAALELEIAGRWWDDLGIWDDGTPRVCFVGSHSSAFDMLPVFNAAKAMTLLGSPCQFIICGEGANTSVWRDLTRDMPNVHFPGWVDRSKIEALALRSTAALAPYKNTEDFKMSIPNKVIDALALGLPVLSPLQGEVESLILTGPAGISYGLGVEKALEQSILELITQPALRAKLSNNARLLYESRFSFETVYGGLVSHLEHLSVKD